VDGHGGAGVLEDLDGARVVGVQDDKSRFLRNSDDLGGAADRAQVKN
jgi:hypothetical protein